MNGHGGGRTLFKILVVGISVGSVTACDTSLRHHATSSGWEGPPTRRTNTTDPYNRISYFSNPDFGFATRVESAIRGICIQLGPLVQRDR